MTSSSAFAMLHNKIRTAAEFSGMEPDQILRELHQDAERQLAREYDERQAAKYGVKQSENGGEESFPQEIRLIARALAYRQASLEDLQQLETLLNKAYKAELEGAEAFRGDQQAVSTESITYHLTEASYQWLVIEAPTGQTAEPEGTILGACCYSTDGNYRMKGKSLMKLGSIRYFAVLPRYHGLCIGQRLLARVHDIFHKQGCQLALVNIPSARLSLIDWIQRRGYDPVNEVAYPFEALGHVSKTADSNAAGGKGEVEPITLVQCLYPLVEERDLVVNADPVEGTVQPANPTPPPTQSVPTATPPSVPFPGSVVAKTSQTKPSEAAMSEDDSAQPKTSYLFQPGKGSTTVSAPQPTSVQQKQQRLAQRMQRLTLDSGELIHVDTAANAGSIGEDAVADELNRVD